MADIIAFNGRLADSIESGEICKEVLHGLPDIRSNCGFKVMTAMSHCAVRLAHPLEHLQEFLRHRSSRAPAVSRRPVADLYVDWLELARIKAMAALAGRHAVLPRMHLTWPQAQWIASLSKSEMEAIAVGFEPRLLGFARPRLFEGAGQVHPSLHSAYAVLP